MNTKTAVKPDLKSQVKEAQQREVDKPATQAPAPDPKHELPLEPALELREPGKLTDLPAPVAEEVGQEVTAWEDDLAAMAGAGFEDVKAADMAMPFFKLLQATSGECKRSEPTYIAGALEGMWFDTISKEFFDEIDFVPCHYRTEYVEWGSKIGEFIRNHGKDDSVMRTTKQDPKSGANLTAAGTRIVPTATWFGIVIGGVKNADDKEKRIEITGLDRRCVITLSGTQQKVSRRWVSDASSLRLTNSKGVAFNPPLFAMSYHLGKAATKNDQGSWFLATVARGGWTLDYGNGRQVLNAAIEFSKLAKEIQLTTAMEDETPAASSGGNGQRGRSEPAGERDSPPQDDEIPF